jgi:hypothetical protein
MSNVLRIISFLLVSVTAARTPTPRSGARAAAGEEERKADTRVSKPASTSLISA